MVGRYVHVNATVLGGLVRTIDSERLCRFTSKSLNRLSKRTKKCNNTQEATHESWNTLKGILNSKRAHSRALLEASPSDTKLSLRLDWLLHACCRIPCAKTTSRKVHWCTRYDNRVAALAGLQTRVRAPPRDLRVVPSTARYDRQHDRLHAIPRYAAT